MAIPKQHKNIKLPFLTYDPKDSPALVKRIACRMRIKPEPEAASVEPAAKRRRPSSAA